MGTDTKIGIQPVNIALSLYDLLGYLTPGFVLILGSYGLIYLSNLELRSVLTGDIRLLDNWCVIISIFVSSYILGHIISWVSKLVERIPILLGWGTITYFLFQGNPESKIWYKKGISNNLLERFIYNYRKHVLKEETQLIRIDNRCDFLNSFLFENRLKYSDLIWDSTMYLLNKTEPSHNVAYSFLSFSGFFRTLSFTWLSLFLGTVIFAGQGYLTFNRSVVLLMLFIFLMVSSFFRYVKFERMHNYQIIRSLSIMVTAPTRRKIKRPRPASAPPPTVKD